MNIKHLQAFLHLSQSLHFNQTAQAIHTSPSTLSRMIQRLETEFGQSLFQRDNRQVELTSAGLRFKNFAETIIAEWQQLKLDFDRSSNKLSGEITIYSTVTAAQLYLPRLIESFRQQYPLVNIKLETGDVGIAYQKIEQGEADFAFAVGEEHRADKFAFQHIEHVPFQIIAPRQTTAFSQYLMPGKIQWNRLPIVMPEAGPGQRRVAEWLNKLNAKPSVYAKVAGNEAIVSMVALGCGISAVPEPVLNLSPVKQRVQILAVPTLPRPFDLGIVSLKRRLEAPLIRAFWQLVVEQGATSYQVQVAD